MYAGDKISGSWNWSRALLTRWRHSSVQYSSLQIITLPVQWIAQEDIRHYSDQQKEEGDDNIPLFCPLTTDCLNHHWMAEKNLEISAHCLTLTLVIDVVGKSDIWLIGISKLANCHWPTNLITFSNSPGLE